MSRSLAIVTTKVVTIEEGDRIERTHLIAVDTETGKGVRIDLDAFMPRWMPIPTIPVHLLGPIDCDTCGGGDRHADNCPERIKLVATDFKSALERAAETAEECARNLREQSKEWNEFQELRRQHRATPAEPRTLASDLEEDRG